MASQCFLNGTHVAFKKNGMIPMTGKVVGPAACGCPHKVQVEVTSKKTGKVQLVDVACDEASFVAKPFKR